MSDLNPVLARLVGHRVLDIAWNVLNQRAALRDVEDLEASADLPLSTVTDPQPLRTARPA